MKSAIISCPECGSQNYSTPSTWGMNHKTISSNEKTSKDRLLCKNCGFIGVFTVMSKINLVRFHKRGKSGKRVAVG